MKVTGDVNSILNYKGSKFYAVAPEDTVFAAITLMAEKNVGALLVTVADELLGILSERDYSRKIVLKGRSSKETLVKDIMVSPPISVGPSHSVDECLHIMTDKRVRHLPVVHEGKILGVISIGDLVNWVISAQSAHIDHLESYISGKYPG